MLAAENGDADCVRNLLSAGAAVNEPGPYGRTALMLAAEHGRADCVRALLEGGAAVNQTLESGLSAVLLACCSGHVETVGALLEAGADAHLVDLGVVSMLASSLCLGVAQLLCAYGMRREELFSYKYPLLKLDRDCSEWLMETGAWISELHHVELLPPARVRTLLADGADPHASDGMSADSPTPLGLARALLARNAAHVGAKLVVDAVAPWSRHNHALFPEAARARAFKLLLLGHLLAREARLALDVWEHHIMALVVCR